MSALMLPIMLLRFTLLCLCSIPVASAAERPVLTLPVRVHLVRSDTMPDMHTTLVEADVRRIFGKVNKVWSQAGIQFEIESIGPTTAKPLAAEMRLKPEFDRIHSMIPKNRLSPTALDVCYVKKVQPNGFFYGEPIVVKDTASLKEVPGGLDEPLPRVTSHEIGHALGLKHRQDTVNLMASGTTGFSLNETEITIARAHAQERLAKFEKEVPRDAVIAQIEADFSLKRERVTQAPWSQLVENDNWYHRSRVMEWRVYGEEATKTVAPAGGKGDFICDGSDDDIEIQKAIDSLPARGGKVVLLPGTYVVGNCIRPRNGTELEIRGAIRVADAVRSDLTADVHAKDTAITVADVSKFRAGQWVTVCEDNDKLNHKGGRRYGETVTITAIDGNRLTLSRPLGVRWAKSRKEVTGYTVARKAFVTTSHSAIMLDGVERVFIHGGAERGVIDGNRAGQPATAPLATDDDVEDLRANCCIGIVRSSWVKVDNLILRDANLHNIAFYKTRHCEASRLECTGCNDKNICALSVDMLRIIGNHCHDTVMEDGICCHGPGGPDILIANNTTTGHKRYGIHVGILSPRATIVRNTARDNRTDLLLLIEKRKGLVIPGTGKPPPPPSEAEMKSIGALVFENRFGKSVQ